VATSPPPPPTSLPPNTPSTTVAPPTTTTTIAPLPEPAVTAERVVALLEMLDQVGT
jgi:hypothetical protein